ncbi:MAG: hypothetical protein OXI15_03505 [Chromatiales bacterium]|nr:hypothetical protein [Chromatiales bacterium]
MPSLTIRIRTEDDQRAIEAVRAATGRNTASGALMHAARRYPRVVESLREARREADELRRELRELRSAVAAWRETVRAEEWARAALVASGALGVLAD